MSYHRDTESALDRIESALTDAQHALSCLPDVDDYELENDLGTAVDELREIWDTLDGIGTTDLEDVEDECSRAKSALENVITNLQDHYNRL